MRSNLLFLILLLIQFSVVRAEEKVLKIYSDAAGFVNYPASIYPVQVGRFDLPAPGFIKEISVVTGGDAGDKVTLHIYGHEGGQILPGFEKDLIDPIVIEKQKAGEEKISVVLSEPLFLNDDQFFIAFTDFSGNAAVMMDKVDHPVPCQSGSGGNYRYILMKGTTQQWAILPKNSAFAIEITIDYPVFVSPQHFIDVTTDAGINSALSNKTMATADFDDDGYIDLLVAGKLYRNNKDWTFTELNSSYGMTTATPGLNAFVDADNDGKLDVFMLGLGSNRSGAILYQNLGGSFKEIVFDSLVHLRSPSSISFADLNNDGYPDFFISQLWGEYPVPQPNYLFFNKGNLSFSDTTVLIYPQYDGKDNYPSRVECDPGNQSTWLSGGNKNNRSRGSEFVDYDNDGDLDLYVTNYFLESDEFYENKGNGVFTNIQSLKQIDVNNTGSNHGTGVDWADYDNDGDMDLLLPQFAHPRFIGAYDHRGTTLYQNSGSPEYRFTDTRGKNGIHFEETHAGAAWGDVDNDGQLDFYITTYYGCRYVDLYLQEDDHLFSLKTFEWGLDNIVTGEDAIFADFNNDGKLDLVSGEGNRVRIYKNKNNVPARFFMVSLRSENSNRFSIGARVKVYSDGKMQMREIGAGKGQRMQEPFRTHFGVKWAGIIDSLVVVYPDGKTERYQDIEPNKHLFIREGVGIEKELPVDPDPATPSLGTEERWSNDEINISAYPTPTKNSTLLNIRLSSGGPLKVDIYDATGRLTEEIFSGHVEEGNHQFQVLQNNGEGIYFYRIQTGTGDYAGKLLKQ